MNATLISTNQRFGNQQGHNDFYWNGPTNYTQEPYPSSSSFNFTRNYDAGFYQDPSPPIPMSYEQSLFEQLLERQRQFAADFTDKIDAMTSDLYGKIEAVLNHVQKLEAQNSQDAESLQRQDESAAYRSVCRSTPSICIDRQASGKQTESRSQLSDDPSSSAMHVDRHTPDTVDRHDPRAYLPYVVIPPSVKSNDYAFSLETSDEITAGYVNKLSSSKQASTLEDWSGTHLFSTRLSEEVPIRGCDDVFVVETRIDELSYRKHGDIQTVELVSIDTTTCVDRHTTRAESDLSEKALSRVVIDALDESSFYRF